MISIFTGVSANRIWNIDRKDRGTIKQTGHDPHTVCKCERIEDAARIMNILRDFKALEEKHNLASDQIALLTTQRNALLNAVEIAGFRLVINNGVTLEIEPSNGTADGRNFAFLQSLEPTK